MASFAFKALHGMVRSSQRFPYITALHLTNFKKLAVTRPNSLESLHLPSWSWGMVVFDTKLSLDIFNFLENGNNKEILGNIKALWSPVTIVSKRKATATRRLYSE